MSLTFLSQFLGAFPKALWPLGANFGVVTSLVFQAIPAPTTTAFHLVWPHRDAAAVVGVWQDWAPTAPDELAASLLLSAAGDPGKPPAVNLFGAMLGTESEAGCLLEAMVARAGADPASTYLEHMTFREAKRYLAELGDAMSGEDDRLGEPSQGYPYSKSEFFRRPLLAEAIAALLENLTEGRSAGELRELDFTPWGGAYNRVPAEATAFAHRNELFLLQHVVVAPDAPAAERQAPRRWLERSWELVHPWGSGRVYPNFPDPDLGNRAHAYHGFNLERLVRVKAKYDPDNFFRSCQSLQDPVPGGISWA